MPVRCSNPYCDEFLKEAAWVPLCHTCRGATAELVALVVGASLACLIVWAATCR